MEKYAWMAKLKPGKKEEYIYRHDPIWPEMIEVLKGVEYATKVQAESPIVDKWNEYMKDVMEMIMDPVTHAQPHLEQVFYLK